MAQMAYEWINRRYLDGKDAIKIKRRFANAKPYPHLALDSFLNNQAAYDLANAVLKEKFERHRARAAHKIFRNRAEIGLEILFGRTSAAKQAA